MNGRCALLLTNDPLEAYVSKSGSLPDQASLSPAGVFDRVVVAYQACRGGRWRPRPDLTIYRVRAVPGRGPRAVRSVAFMVSLLWFLVRVARIARRERVDVVRAYNPFSQGAAAVLAARYACVPSVVAVHTDSSEVLKRLDAAAARFLGVLERYALRHADRVWCLTAYLRDMAVARGASPQRIRVVPNGVPMTAFARGDPAREAATRHLYGIPPKAPVIVAVGRLDAEKDPLTLVRAAALLREREARLVLVGDGSLRVNVEEEAGRAGLDGRVLITGFRPREEVPSLLHIAHCYVMGSLYEGFPHALAEALAAGVPVVASDIPQLDELLAGTGARRFPPGDVAALAARIGEVLADPERARVVAAAGRARVACFDVHRARWVEASLYRELLPERRVEVGSR